MTESQQALTTRQKEELQGEGVRPGPVFRPDIDVLETKEGFTVYADLPGADESTVDVKIDKEMLTLDARLGAQPDEAWTPVHSEYQWGSFHREFRIHGEIDVAGVSAKMQNGVLELQLPKTVEVQPRAIPVSAG